MKIGIGLYGTNGHQITHLVKNHEKAQLVAVAAFPEKTLSGLNDSAIKSYTTLEELLSDDRVQLVSLCSPIRKDQAEDAVKCLEAGKHVYAEKPCAMSEKDLDRILETACKKGLKFHEMAGTAFEEPYSSIRQAVKAGAVGEVIQVLAQKSYPYHDGRPQDEDVDAGLLMQVGIHAIRFIEHVAGVRIKNISAVETKLGNTCKEGNLHMAASYMMTLENGGVASVVSNYLNPKAFGKWGNEHLRIFGTKGFIEAVDAGTRTRLVTNEKDMGALELTAGSRDYFDYICDEILGLGEMPISLDEELHPARVVIRAKQAAVASNL